MLRIFRKTSLLVLATAVTAGAWLAFAPPAQADHGRRAQCNNCRPQQYGNPDLFYNYYVPGNCGGVPAAMYMAPQPVPAQVGHTYITYQPFMPHEMLYAHHRSYYRYYNGGRGMTRESVHWYNPPVVSAFQGLHNHFRIAR